MPQVIIDRFELEPQHKPVAHLVAEHAPEPGEHARLVAERQLAVLAVNKVDPGDHKARTEAHGRYVSAHAAVQAYEEKVAYTPGEP